MTAALRVLYTGNTLIARCVVALAIMIMALLLLAMATSAVTRHLSGWDYGWLIELPPALIPWLVFLLLGPLFRSGSHIQMDFLPALLSENYRQILRLISSMIAFIASIIFIIAGIEAIDLFRSFDQMMDLQIEIPIWMAYLAFPTGFTILASFALEAALTSVQALRGKATPESPKA